MWNVLRTIGSGLLSPVLKTLGASNAFDAVKKIGAGLVRKGAAAILQRLQDQPAIAMQTEPPATQEYEQTEPPKRKTVARRRGWKRKNNQRVR